LFSLNVIFQDTDKMPKKRCWLIFVIVIFAAAFVSPGCKKKPAEQTPAENNEKPVADLPTLSDAEGSPFAPAGQAIPKRSLQDVIASARTWGPAYNRFFGQTAPDFTITDITGKQHKLSDYRGKNVMLIFWATWCGPCKKELPHLIALRNVISEDKLAMLAVSYISSFPPETTEGVKYFVKQNKINYTVFSTNPGTMPPPFSRVSGIPCSFFIDPQGKIKLATEGLLSLGEIKAILQAE
jgi:peroxiredoxin